MKHPVAWRTASPLWEFADMPDRFHRPVLLRFAGMGFMDDLSTLLAESPAALAEYVARPETGEDEAVGWQEEERGDLTLFQPIHNRFYLVAASLVCEVLGLPDRVFDRRAGEEVSYVVRRITDHGAAGWDGDRQHGVWRALETVDQVADFEERLPLFTLVFHTENRRRRLLAGLVPAAGQTLYEATAPGAFYHLRCVYEHRQCGALDQPLLSAASRAFRFAPYDHPNAPLWPFKAQRPAPAETSRGQGR